ncbi:hypothetical protein P7C70_g4028, partial [Phenoliferia sp. Uapishka_3]
MPNHISHSLAPILFITSFLLLLFTFLSPTSMFTSSVDLLKLSATTASKSTSSTRMAKRWTSDNDVPTHIRRNHKMLKLPGWKRSVNSTAAAANSTTSETSSATTAVAGLKIVFGPMGQYHFHSILSRAYPENIIRRRLLPPQYLEDTTLPESLVHANLHSNLRAHYHSFRTSRSPTGSISSGTYGDVRWDPPQRSRAVDFRPRKPTVPRKKNRRWQAGEPSRIFHEDGCV